MHITTKTTTSRGKDAIVAKGEGKQRTVVLNEPLTLDNYDRMHGSVAGELALALGLTYSDSIEAINIMGGFRFIWP